MRVYVRRAVRAGPAMEAERTDGHDHSIRHAPRSARRSAARCRASKAATRSPAAPNTPTPCGCPACCMPRSSAARWRTAASSRSTPARRKKVPGVLSRRHRRRRDEGHPEPLLRPGLPRPADPGASRRCASSASRSPSCSPPIRTSPRRRRSSSSPNTRNCRRSIDEVEALTSKVYVHDELKPAGTFADLKHLKDAKNTNLALDYRLRRGDFDKAFAAAAHMFEHEFRTQKVLHLVVRAVRLASPTTRTPASPSTAPRRARRSCAPRSRACSAGRRTRCASRCRISARGYGAKLYIKLEALALALSMIARRPVKVALTMEEQFYQITKHPTTFRIKSGVDKDGTHRRAQVRGVLERRRLCRHRPARDAEIGLHRVRPLRHRQRLRSIPTRSTPT